MKTKKLLAVAILTSLFGGAAFCQTETLSGDITERKEISLSDIVNYINADVTTPFIYRERRCYI